MKDQIASIPLLPRVSRKSWPIGRGSDDPMRSDTEFVAKEAAISSNQPRLAVEATPTIMAIGAAKAALVVSSDT
jgi:hypothetical protein